MREKIIFLATIALLFTASMTTVNIAYSQEAITLYVEPPSLTENFGSTFDVNVNIRNVDAATQFVGVDFRLSYDSNLLEVVKITEGSFLQDPEWNTGMGTFFVAYNYSDDPTWGSHILVGNILLPNETGFWNPPLPHGSGTIATVTFHCIGLGDSALQFLEAHMADTQALSLPYETEDGLVRQAPGPGDLNGDGKVEGKDIAVVAKAFGSYLGHSRWNPDADLNGDGIIEGKDITFVAKNFGKTYLYP